MVGGISVWQLMILLLIVILVFGTKRLRNIGSDLGSAVKGFRKGMEDEPENSDSEGAEPDQIGADDVSSKASSKNTKTSDPVERPPGSDV